MEKDARDLERKSSAVTLSDMEIFIFPELMYALLLANLMSPRIWRWRDDPWFAGLARMKPYRRITRLKQFVMDRYIFNLDLDTWGLTTKQRELARFREFVDPRTIAESNALFGYEGDQYYFDMDIRSHFGLDKYDGDVIPYWKTETVEAMDAFRHKPNYGTGAGECVSLSGLYAAALFLVAGIPLHDIFLMATPLHSQNFVDVEDGILTNNRRLVTKNMWFNGTALSGQARRALENERVTVVAHESGHVHTLYPRATVDPAAYGRFRERLSAFLKVRFAPDIFGNFLRQNAPIQGCFQVRSVSHGLSHYVPAERVFAYEQGSSYLLTDATRDKLLADVESEEFQHDPIPGRIVLNDLEDFIRSHRIDLDRPEDAQRLKQQFAEGCLHRERVIEELLRYCHVRPRLPDENSKQFVPEPEPLGIRPDMTREDVIERLAGIRGRNETADLAFYAYRDLLRTEPDPFLRAAVQRNPVSVAGASGLDEDQLAARVAALPDESIYDGPGRLAQPDEVWNYGRGDGAEKAVLLANLLRSRRADEDMRIEVSPTRAVLKTGAASHEFASAKGLSQAVWSVPGG